MHFLLLPQFYYSFFIPDINIFSKVPSPIHVKKNFISQALLSKSQIVLIGADQNSVRQHVDDLWSSFLFSESVKVCSKSPSRTPPSGLVNEPMGV